MSNLDPTVLANFTGTERWFKHGLVRNVLYTEGVQYVAETAGAYWLLDIIASVQHLGPKLADKEEFQVWKLTRNKKGSGARVSCEDGNDNVVYSQLVGFTDFPEPEFTLWFTGGVILLPSEY